MDAIVLATVAFAFAFYAAWLVSPGLRAWIEKPKYQFQANVQSYDQARQREGGRSTSKP